MAIADRVCVRCGRPCDIEPLRVHWYRAPMYGAVGAMHDRHMTSLVLCLPCALIFRAYVLGWAGEPLGDKEGG